MRFGGGAFDLDLEPLMRENLRQVHQQLRQDQQIILLSLPKIELQSLFLQ